MSGYELRRFRLTHDLTLPQLAEILDVQAYDVMEWEASPDSQRYKPINDPSAEKLASSSVSGGRKVLSGWKGLLRFTAAADAVLLLAIAALIGDREAFIVAVAFIVGLALLSFRSCLIGTALLALLSAHVAALMLPAAWSNARSGEDLVALLIPSSLTATSFSRASRCCSGGCCLCLTSFRLLADRAGPTSAWTDRGRPLPLPGGRRTCHEGRRATAAA